MPALDVFNNQSALGIPDKLLEAFQIAGEKAIPLVLQHLANGGGVISNLLEIEVSIVSDEVIAQVHQDFMDILGATDVITFAHGEIVISAETAQTNALKYGQSFEKEMMLYIIHGLLHLAGHEDKILEQRSEMENIQTRILEEVWA